MPRGDVETFLVDGEWHNRIEGEPDTLGAHTSRQEAVTAGRLLAQRHRSEHIVRNKDGSVHRWSSYRSDVVAGQE